MFATHLSKSATAEYMRIDWETVGRCVSRALHEVEPDRRCRLNGLERIGIDETSYRKGHKYITNGAKSKAKEIKCSAYALGKAPEHLTDNQKIRLGLSKHASRQPITRLSSSFEWLMVSEIARNVVHKSLLTAAAKSTM